MKTEQFQWSAGRGWCPGPPSGTLGASAQLVLVFGGVCGVRASGCLRAVRAAYPEAHIVGCTTAGEIQGTSVREDTVAVTAVGFAHTRVKTARVRIPGVGGSFEAGRQLARDLPAEGLRHLFVLSEGLQVNGSALIRGINAALPCGVTVSGGFAGDGNRLQETHIWCDGEPEQAAAIGVGFYGDRLRVGLAATGGWDPFGPDRLITKSKDNVLYELDGRSALALYKEYLGEHAQRLPASGLLFPLGLRVPGGEQRVMRALLAVDEQAQSITFAGDVPEGTFARLMIGNIERLIASAQVAGAASGQALGAATGLSILVSCNGRRPVLKQLTEDEVEAVGDGLGDPAAMTGFYSYGEIAPVVTGSDAALLNQTMTVTSFAEAG